jgi:glucose-1-phosphate thymidylyltransferase
MKALVLSGGKGTRLRPITNTIAKQLVPVANKPILHYCLDNIYNSGISEIGIIISPETGKFVQESVIAWSVGKKADITYIMQGQPMGLAHTVLISREFLKDDPFVMYLGDNLISENIRELIEQFNKNSCDSLILLKEVKDPKMFGVALIENDKVVRLEEKPENPQSNLALVGVYMFNKSIHKAVRDIAPSKRGELEITEAIQYLIDKDFTVQHKLLGSWWLDTGKKDDLLSANRTVLDEFTQSCNKGTTCSDSKIEGRVEVDETSRIINSTVRGPVIIGKNCTIKNSYIGPFTSISDNVQIENSEIENSVVMSKSRISGVKGRITESLIGAEVNIESAKSIPNTHRFMIGDNSDVIINEN